MPLLSTSCEALALLVMETFASLLMLVPALLLNEVPASLASDVPALLLSAVPAWMSNDVPDLIVTDPLTSILRLPETF